MEQIAVKELLSPDECEYLLTEAKGLQHWDSRNHEFWDNRVVSLGRITDFIRCRDAMDWLVRDIFKRLRSFMQDFYEVPETFVDTMDLVKWPAGMSQPPHVDEIPHAHRKWGSVIYLNDDFDGGQTFYPNFNKYVTPKAGVAVIHRGDQEHLHGVTEVSGGTRFTIASFWGTDPEKAVFFTKDWN